MLLIPLYVVKKPSYTLKGSLNPCYPGQQNSGRGASIFAAKKMAAAQVIRWVTFACTTLDVALHQVTSASASQVSSVTGVSSMAGIPSVAGDVAADCVNCCIKGCSACGVTPELASMTSIYSGPTWTTAAAARVPASFAGITSVTAALAGVGVTLHLAALSSKGSTSASGIGWQDHTTVDAVGDATVAAAQIRAVPQPAPAANTEACTTISAAAAAAAAAAESLPSTITINSLPTAPELPAAAISCRAAYVLPRVASTPLNFPVVELLELNTHLMRREFLAGPAIFGGKLSIADIICYGVVRSHAATIVAMQWLEQLPHLVRWTIAVEAASILTAFFGAAVYTIGKRVSWCIVAAVVAYWVAR